MKIDEFIKKVAELGLKVDKDILNKLLLEINNHIVKP